MSRIQKRKLFDYRYPPPPEWTAFLKEMIDKNMAEWAAEVAYQMEDFYKRGWKLSDLEVIYPEALSLNQMPIVKVKHE